MKKTYNVDVPNRLAVVPEPGILFTRDNATLAYHALGMAHDSGQAIPEQEELYRELGALLFPTRQEQAAPERGVHTAGCGLQGSSLRKHCTCPAGEEGPFETGDLIEYVSHQAGNSGQWVPGVFRSYPNGRPDRMATVTVWQLHPALRGRTGGYLLSRENEIRRIPPEHISAARSWAADCEWIEDGDDIADLTDLQVVAGVQVHYAGGWAAFRETCLA